MATSKKRKKKAEVMAEDGSMTLTDHLKELRNRLIICAVVFVVGVVVSLAYADRLIDLLTAMGRDYYQFVSIAPQEKLMQYFRVSILAAEGLVTWGIRSTAGGQFRDYGAAVDNDSENYEKNCQTAQELMQEAGYTADVLERLEQVVMLYESDGTTDSLAVFLQKTWREKLGIQVTLRGVSASEITKALEQGEYTLAALWVTSDRNDATGFLNRWRTDNEGNYANFNSSAYDMLLGVASVSASKEARDAYLEDAERLLLEKGNVIPLYHSTRSWSLSEKYTGLFGDGLGRYFFAGIHAVSK